MLVGRAQESNKVTPKYASEGRRRKGRRKSITDFHHVRHQTKQHWREAAGDAGLGSAGQTAHQVLYEEAATELLLEINANKETEAWKVFRHKGKSRGRTWMSVAAGCK